MTFPEGFLWGSATSSFQVEGASERDGRGASIWDTFCATPNKVLNGDTGQRACEHYTRYREDIALMKALNLQAYRFSIAWPRVLPQGRGTINAKGLAFYDRLTDSLLEAGIKPLATLYHWDLPQTLQDEGGWANRETLHAFCEYSDLMTRTLGDRIHHWATLNEPWVVAFLGNFTGEHAPGNTSLRLALQVSHNLLVGHGMALDVIRANTPNGTQAGIVLNLNWMDAASDSEADHAAAERHNGFVSRWFLDPLYTGAYPEDMLRLYGADAPRIKNDDMPYLTRPMDFLGINYYTRALNADAPISVQNPIGIRFVKSQNAYTAMDWEVYPQGLENLLVWVHENYSPPAIYITENGCAYDDVVQDGKVHDPQRLDYIQSHFAAAERAIEQGVPLRGYFVWSLLDNFEWAWGYKRRFGIVHVDFETQVRTPKDSALWFRDFIRQQTS